MARTATLKRKSDQIVQAAGQKLADSGFDVSINGVPVRALEEGKEDEQKETEGTKGSEPGADGENESSGKLSRLVNFAKQLLVLDEEREGVEGELNEAKEKLEEAKQVVREFESKLKSLEQRERHIVDCIKGNERGQKTFDYQYDEDSAPSANSTAPATDEGSQQPLSALLKFGLPHKKLEQFQDSKYGDDVDTVGKLEALITKSQGWFWKDVKGWGDAFYTGDGEKCWPAIHLKFRQAYPVTPVDGVDERWRRCSKCQGLFRTSKTCTECGHDCWVPVDEEEQATLSEG